MFSEAFLQKQLNVCFRHPMLVIGCFLLLYLASTSQIPHIQLLVSLPDQFGYRTEKAKQAQLVADKFPSGQTALIAFQSQQPFTYEDLCNIKNWMRGYHLRHVEDIRFLHSPFDMIAAEQREPQLLYRAELPLACLPPDEGIAPLNNLLRSQLGRTIIAEDQKALAIEVTFFNADRSSRFGTFDPEPVKQLKLSLESFQKNNPQLNYFLQGPAEYKSHFIRGLMLDQRINLLVFLVILIFCRIYFGRWKAGLILGGTLTMTMGVLTGLMTSFRVPFDVLSNNLFIILTLATIEDFFYLSLRQAENPKDWQKPFQILVAPSFFTSLTTVFGFGSLVFSDILSVQKLGLWAAVGACLEWAMMFCLLPALASRFPYFRTWTKSQVKTYQWTQRWSRLTIGRPVTLGLGIIMLLSLVGLNRLESNDSIKSLWSSDHPISQSLASQKDRFGWQGQIDVVFRPETKDDRQDQILKKIQAVDGVFSTEDWRSVLANVSRALDNEDYKQVLTRDFKDSPYYRRYVHPPTDWSRSFIYLEQLDSEPVKAVTAQIERICGEQCFISGDPYFYTSYADEVIDTLIKSFGLSMALVTLTLIALCYLRKERYIFATVASSLWGPITLLGLALWILDGINFVTCIFAAVLVGLAGDNSIQYLFSAKNRDVRSGVESCGSGTIAIVLVLQLVALCFLASDFKQPRILGLLFCGGFALLLIGDLWLLKGLTLFKHRSQS